MAQQTIGIGATANDGTGDPLRTAFDKANDNFTELYGSIGGSAPLASPAFTGVPTAPTASPGTSTTQLATTAFVTNGIATAVTGLLEFKGSTDCSGNPNYPAADKGDAYVVSVAGKIGGASGVAVDVGDVFVASADNAGGTQASVGSSWFLLEHNLAGALLAANNLSDLANAATARTNLGLGTIATADAADYRKSPPIPSGQYVTPGGFGGYTTGGTAPGADTLKMFLGYIRRGITITGIGTRVTTTSASGNIKLALYAMDATTGWPTGAPVLTSAALSTTSAAAVQDTSVSQAVTAGWYWFASLCDNATAAFYSLNTTGTASEMSGSASGSTVVTANGLTKGSVTYAGGFPTLTGSKSSDGLSDNTATTMPLMWFKR